MLKLAVSGTHGSGKSTIVRDLAEWADKAGWEVAVVNTPTRYLKYLFGLDNNKDSVGWLEFMNLTTKRVQAAEAAARLIDYERDNDTDKTLLLADRHLLDIIGYLSYLNDHPPVTDDMPGYQSRKIKDRLESLYEIGREFAFLDVEWWDHIYYKPPHPGFLDADNDRLSDRGYQLDIAQRIRHQWEVARQHGARTSLLDVDRDAAAKQIWDTINNEEKAAKVYGR